MPQVSVYRPMLVNLIMIPQILLKQTKSAASTQNSERNVSSSCMSVHAFVLILAVKKNGDRYGKLTISDETYNQQDEVFTIQR